MRSPSLPAAAPLLLLGAALVAAAVGGASSPAGAQERQQPDVVRGVGATPEDARAGAAFARAQRLVAEGQGAAGRAIVDSTLGATAPTSPVYAEGLFWRASLAATAADAERDYRTLAVEYPLSPRSADALLRLAQLELARGDRALAVKHLERLTLEHPTSPARPRASYWMARVYFESSDLPRACSALDAARAGSAPNEVGLRAQIDAYASRCKNGAATTTVASAAPTATTPLSSPSTGLTTQTAAGARNAARDTSSIFGGAAIAHASPVASAAPATVTPAVVAAAPTKPAAATTATPSSGVPPVAVPAAPFPATVAATAAATPVTASPAAPAPNAKYSAAPRTEAKPAPAASASPPPALATAVVVRPAAPAPVAPSRAATRVVFSVQLAAFDAAAPAEALAARLRGRGLDARVSGTAAPFRVRVGHYATSGAAAREAAALKARGQPAFVVDEVVPAVAPR
ncbi:MAG TPA: SPOR domain-containing protein [Gemmatimonadaceae bacterium]|nr:SPOR domain-containing protein [Gemmatimonadaceae bacterium]